MPEARAVQLALQAPPLYGQLYSPVVVLTYAGFGIDNSRQWALQ
jgi:hypothetical protein